MPRTPYDFQSTFDAGCRACGFTPTQVTASADRQAQLLDLFNRAHQIGYDYPADGFEDARTSATITPSSRLITYDTLGDASEFNIFTEDNRPEENSARRVSFTTNSAGILLAEELSTVWVSWLPASFEFVTTAWATSQSYAVGDKRVLTTNGHVYRCLVAHTSGTFATDLAANKWVLMPILALLKEFIISYMTGLYQIEAGQTETGLNLQTKAERDLDRKVTREAQRNNR